MSKNPELDRDEIEQEFGVQLPELKADVRGRIGSLDAGEGMSSTDLRKKIQLEKSARLGDIPAWH